MATLDMKALNRVTTGDAPSPRAVTVGNNRTIEKLVSGCIAGYLHGHRIVLVNFADRMIHLNTCGYSTSTTRAAMRDFVEAVTGIPCGVSFAKGEFSVRLGGRDWEAANGRTIDLAF